MPGAPTSAASTEAPVVGETKGTTFPALPPGRLRSAGRRRHPGAVAGAVVAYTTVGGRGVAVRFAVATRVQDTVAASDACAGIRPDAR